MGINESTIKLITEPINNMIGTCNHSDCKTKCGEHCFEIEIDTTHPINTFPVLQPKENSRESHDSILSNVTLIVERTNEQKYIYNNIIYYYYLIIYITLYNE